MNQKYKVLLGLLCIFELLLFTYAKNIFGMWISPVVIFLISLTIGLIPLLIKKDTLQLSTPQTGLRIPTPNQKVQWLIFGSLMLAGFISTYNLTCSVTRTFPIEVAISDVIPLIQKMTTRFWAGEYPYKFFNDFGYDFWPTQLPLQWMPFVIAEKLNVDYRIWAMFIFFFSLLLLFIGVIRSKMSFFEKVFIIVLSFLTMDAILLTDAISIGATVEEMIMAYYIILCVLMVNRSHPLLRAAVILLPLLSRFSFLFWLPLYGLSMLLYEGKSKTIKSIALVVVGVLLIYVFPYWLKDTTIFSNSQHHYTQATVGEWSREDAPHLHNGLGLAPYFLYYTGGTIEHKIKLMQLINFGLCFLMIAILGGYLWKNKTRLDSRLFNMASIKIIIAIFYSFIQIPYSYLYLMPLGLSLVVLYAVFKVSAADEAPSFAPDKIA